MSGPQPADRAHVNANDAPDVHYDGAQPDELRPGSAAAKKQIDDILGGGHDPAQLAQLVSFLDDATKATYVQHFSEFAHVPGDLALDSALILHVDVNTAVTTALHGHPKATRDGLHRYLAGVDAGLAKMSAATIALVRPELPGSLADHVPWLYTSVEKLDANGPMLRWFAETTPVSITASIFAHSITDAMIQTLDKEHLWGWVDVLHPTQVGYDLARLIPQIADSDARTRLTSLANGRSGMTVEAILDDRKKPANEGLLHAQLAKPTATVQSLLDAASREMFVGDKDRPQLMAALTRLKAPADDVLAFAEISGNDPALLLGVLLESPGVTAQHVAALLARGSIYMLTNAKTRSAVRSLAPGLSLSRIVAPERDLAVDPLLASPALLAWYAETASPLDLLWLCTARLETAAKATRIVQDAVGLAWVRQLPAMPGNDQRLRTLSLYCHDEPTVSYIRHHLLGQSDFDEKVEKTSSEPTDLATRSGQGGRLIDAIGDAGTSAEIVARLGDLDEQVRAKLGADDAALATITKNVATDDYGRAARLLGLTFVRTVAHSPGRSSATLAYLDTRPQAEELAALRIADFDHAASMVHRNLLLVFPSLGDPKLLATMIEHGNLLKLLLAGSDPSRVAELLANDAVRPKAEAVLDEHPELVKLFPRYRDLSSAGKHGVDQLDKHADADSGAKDDLGNERAGSGIHHDPLAARQGTRLGDARKKPTLVEAIEALGTKHEQATTSIENEKPPDPFGERGKLEDEAHIAETDALAMLAEHKAEVPALLADRTQHPLVKKLASMIDLPPSIAIPWIDPAELVRMPNAVTWWMTFRDPLVLLHRLSSNQPALLLVAGGINTGTMGALEWLKRLPKGFELDSIEDRVIDQLRPLVRNDATGIQALFEVRFGVPAPTGYSVKMVNELWDVIGRLPPAQLKQERISRFRSEDKAGMGDASGLYSPGDRRIDLRDDMELGSSTDTFYQQQAESWYTRAELQQRFGYDNATFDQLLGQGRLETRAGYEGPPQQQDHIGTGLGKSQILYRIKEQTLDLFTQTVLHEVGHSVDDILGTRTPPVWDYAGWHEYSDATFDEWAAEMGGWEHVAAADKAQIKDVWVQAMRGSAKVDALVGPGHPALDVKKYPNVGLVKLGAEGRGLHYVDRTRIGDRIFVAGTVTDSWFSLKASAAEVAPSYYSLNAPAEYFAESYVEYYRGVDGSPGSPARKGGALAGPVKQWFDENVDKLKYDPHRFAGGASDRVKDAGETQPSAVKPAADATKKSNA